VLSDQKAKEAAIRTEVAADVSEVLARAASNDFWKTLEAHITQTPPDLQDVDWLDIKMGPLGEQGSAFFLRLVGTDLDDFRSTFGKIRIVEGEQVPSGTRGVLVGKAFLEKRIKFGVAMSLDSVSNGIAKGKTISGAKDLQDFIAKAKRQANRIVYLIPPKDVAAVTAELEKRLATKAPLLELLATLLELNDENFADRYKTFYEVIAPRIQLYPFRIGDTLTMTSFTKSGYIKSVNVKVFGIYTIDGLETSDIAGALSLTDLATFRELYGQRTTALDEELQKMKESAGAKAVDRKDAEDALFGDSSTSTSVKTTTAAAAEVVVAKVDRVEATTFDPKTIKEGLALSAAVLLKNPDRLRETMTAIDSKVASIKLKSLDWQNATGVIGQITQVVRVVLLAAIFILFLVTTVILNNSLVMATLERVAEFGTLRAIGAQRGFVLAMVVLETAVLGVLAGLVGAGLGVAFVVWLSSVGIPAPADLLQVLFGGPRLFPTVTAGNVVAGLVATFIVSVFATLYPAGLAMRVAPVVAMQGKE
jgi:ABC-type antimicrobial peptide transport system permease subunit